MYHTSASLLHKEKAEEAIVFTPFARVIVAKLPQFLKALPLMEVTPSGILMEVRDVHSSKAYSPMEVTPFPKITVPSPVHLLKTPLLMEVTLFGILMEFSEEQP